MDPSGANPRSAVPPACIPATLAEALDRSWLTAALAPVSGGVPVVAVEVVKVLEAMACKARVAVTLENRPRAPLALCIKAFFRDLPYGSLTMWREAQFYLRIAPHTGMRTPACIAAVARAQPENAILLLADLVAEGARFCSADEAFDVGFVAQSLEQIARLHACSQRLDNEPWIPCRVQDLAGRKTDVAALQVLMHDERRGALPERTLDASRLLAAIRQLAQRNATRPQTVLHGDSHGGNVYVTAQGPGIADWQLVQRGSWALDVAYHIAATLSEDVAEREERRLLAHYLDVIRQHGGHAPSWDEAWEDFRCAVVYGYYHWAITSKVAPEITNVVFRRLGSAVTRHDSYRLLGI
jgi:hypothetical protein